MRRLLLRLSFCGAAHGFDLPSDASAIAPKVCHRPHPRVVQLRTAVAMKWRASANILKIQIHCQKGQIIGHVQKPEALLNSIQSK
jgi:hypothetical protein